MFLNYLSLGILLVALTLVFYTIIYIHDIPAKIAEERHHPQKEVIHVAGWLSLLMLHVLWPFLFMWAVWRPGPAVPTAPSVPTVPEKKESEGTVPSSDRVAELEERIKTLEAALLVGKGV